MSGNAVSPDDGAVAEGQLTDEQKCRAALVLLRGYLIERDGQLSRQYVGIRDEKPLRQALTDLLRSRDPLPIPIREALADLIDPQPQRPSERTVRFVRRTQGRPSDPIRNSAIAETIHRSRSVGQTTEAGIQAAMERFGVERRYVQKVWSRYQPIFAEIDATTDPLPEPNPDI